MFNVLDDLNWLGILLAFIAFVLLGGVWFAALFPKPYNRSLGREADAKPLGTPLFYAGPPLTALIITITSAILMAALRIDTYGDALLFGLIVGLGYLTANTVNIAINPNFPRPLAYAAISGPYNLLGSLIVSVVLVAV
ncbi:DUF1761 domain-containing protein [Paractinoplanes lichenicola]|uniref:DUF1761 domain-containing protein n=1 Tax=Paractinoplanes lichenicola TaxID=2802976 RepID=A0ABS1VF36_9ACTN|nr:DUF1761 domain-containing protein [Actinoplanes lichenicola]MBL7253315.1 DUF1761 domain-containing protein [Actinoplanes lichenicola]